MENVTFPDYFTTYNNTEDPGAQGNVFHIIQIINIILYSITFILGFTGNGLVIWIAGFKMKKTVTILWFLNLAIADFVFNLTFPLQITEWIMDGHWPFGQAMCKVVFTVLFLNMSVSTSFLMIISVDRCTSVMCPVWSKNHKSPRLALTISLTIWFICFMLSSPYLAFFDILHDSENRISYCIPLYAEDDDTDTMRYKTMIVVRFVSMFLIPFSIIVTCYSFILFRLRRTRSLSRSNRPLKVIITIVLCFFCFWFPFHIWPLLEVLNVDLNFTVDMIVSHVVYCIGFFNSCVNPIVYVFFGRDFKKSLFRSIPFLLEDTLKEKDLSDTQIDRTVMETEMESYD
ncbi:chemerin-like receptor 1 [Hyla sarda]|uniref:chemerin-like receptor 1 n=1 Tax=Hyla sarda TaxID=327740 RepID=UPI0024C2EA2D|nr:chemerin-like receptor 1 [Hyla sarda]XP_056399231.1 chemerin-like receptor 1 [Hyla sarda]XP_056399232.1 chemerin-like receptor 1 [Hyla sarda]